MIFSPTMILPFHLSLPLQFQISILIPGVPLLCLLVPFSFQVFILIPDVQYLFAASNSIPGVHSHSRCPPFGLHLPIWIQVSTLIPSVCHFICDFHSDSRCPFSFQVSPILFVASILIPGVRYCIDGTWTNCQWSHRMAGYGSAPHNYPPEIAKDQQLLIVSPIWPLFFWWLPFYWWLLYSDRMIIHKPVGTFAMYFACLGSHVPETFLGSVGPFRILLLLVPEQSYFLTSGLQSHICSKLTVGSSHDSPTQLSFLSQLLREYYSLRFPLHSLHIPWQKSDMSKRLDSSVGHDGDNVWARSSPAGGLTWPGGGGFSVWQAAGRWMVDQWGASRTRNFLFSTFYYY